MFFAPLNHNPFPQEHKNRLPTIWHPLLPAISPHTRQIILHKHRNQRPCQHLHRFKKWQIPVKVHRNKGQLLYFSQKRDCIKFIVFITKFTERLIIANDGVGNAIIISGMRQYGHVLIFVVVSNFNKKKTGLFKKLIGI